MKHLIGLPVVLLLLVATLVGCLTPSVTPLATTAPTIESFTATPSSLPAGGGQVTLSWKTTGASSLSIDQGVGNVTGLTQKTVSVTSSVRFSLVATNTSGLIASSDMEVKVAPILQERARLRIVNVIAFSSYVEVLYTGSVVNLKVNGTSYYPGILDYGATSYFDVPSGKNDLLAEIYGYAYETDSQNNSTTVYKTIFLNLKGIELEKDKNYSLYVHRNFTKNLDLTVINESSIAKSDSPKIRFIDFYDQKNAGNSKIKIFNDYESCESTTPVNQPIAVVSLLHKKPSNYIELKPGSYSFRYSTGDYFVCRGEEFKPGPGNYSIVVGGPESDGGTTIAVVSD